jgi:hypothetical protein
MLSDYFSGEVALEPLRAWIPTCHDTRSVEHKDGVVRHCLNEEAVSSFNRQRCQISVGLFHQSSPNTPADDVDASATKLNTRRMNGSWNADSRNGANEMRIGGQPQDCVGDGLDSSVGHCRANGDISYGT